MRSSRRRSVESLLSCNTHLFDYYLGRLTGGGDFSNVDYLRKYAFYYYIERGDRSLINLVDRKISESLECFDAANSLEI